MTQNDPNPSGGSATPPPPPHALASLARRRFLDPARRASLDARDVDHCSFATSNAFVDDISAQDDEMLKGTQEHHLGSAGLRMSFDSARSVMGSGKLYGGSPFNFESSISGGRTSGVERATGWGLEGELSSTNTSEDARRASVESMSSLFESTERKVASPARANVWQSVFNPGRNFNMTRHGSSKFDTATPGDKSTVWDHVIKSKLKDHP